MHKVEPYPQEFEHRDVWLPGAPASPGLRCSLCPACVVVAKLHVKHLGWRPSISGGLLLESE